MAENERSDFFIAIIASGGATSSSPRAMRGPINYAGNDLGGRQQNPPQQEPLSNSPGATVICYLLSVICMCAPSIASPQRNSHEIRARSNNLRNRDLVLRFLCCYEVLEFLVPTIIIATEPAIRTID